MIKEHLKTIAKAAALANNKYRDAHPNAPLSRNAVLDEQHGSPRWSGFLEFPETSDLRKSYAKMGTRVTSAFESFVNNLPKSARPFAIEFELDDYNGEAGAITKVAMNFSLAGMQVSRMAHFEASQDYGAHHLSRWVDLHERLDLMASKEPEADWLVTRGGGGSLGHQSGRFEVTRLRACGEREAALKALAISRGPKYILDALDDGNHAALSAEMNTIVISRVTERSATEILEQEFPQRELQSCEVEGP